MLSFKQFLLESTNTQNPVNIDLYHGSGRNFDQFNQSYGRVKNDFMGGGIGYFTSDHDVAKTYAKNGARFAGTNTRYVYHTTLNMENVFDVDHNFSGERLKQILPPEKDHEQFARSAGLLNVGTDKYDILSKLKQGNITLTGQQIFQGLSRGGVSSDRARQHLIKKGYDGLRYNGDQNMDQAQKHSVYIPYNASAITIRKKTLLDNTVSN